MALLLAVCNYKTARVYSIKKNNVELDEIHYTCHVLGRVTIFRLL
jgi:hypothetical protein